QQPAPARHEPDRCAGGRQPRAPAPDPDDHGTAILAMVPIALSETQLAGEGPPYYPMARAIAGGLAFSTVVTLLFLPTIYAILDDLSHGTTRLLRRARRRRGDPAPA